jgi:putative ABC transport system permease protein
MTFLIETLLLGLVNLSLHKSRSLLTALGIIFGVAAVITMVAIGEGNKQKALADIRELGARNVIVRSVKPPSDATRSGSSSQVLIDYGIRRKDIRRIESTIAGIERIVSLKRVGSNVTSYKRKVAAEIFGTTSELAQVTRLRVARGRYLSDADQLKSANNVAVLGAAVAERLFPLQDPLDKLINIDQQSFKVVGILRPVGLAAGAGTALVGRDLNFDVHIPMSAAMARFGDTRVNRGNGSFEATSVEVSEVYIQIKAENAVPVVADQIRFLLNEEHKEKGDVTTIVPLELLIQAEKTQKMFNVLMVAISSVSLLVGGIGIMNIMLATVTERTREIGIRRALGATRMHIAYQFLVETTVLSGIGGIIGILVGLGAIALLVYANQYFPSLEKPRIVPISILVSFVVASSVGIIFGLYPAVQASRQDPIVALRHD